MYKWAQDITRLYHYWQAKPPPLGKVLSILPHKTKDE